MLFNSLQFFLFFSLFFVFYWLVFSKNLKWQNVLILVASYVFYAIGDWRFLLLLIFSSVLNYFIGIGIHKFPNHKIKKLLLFCGLFVGLGGLVIFKYLNFFIISFQDAFALIHLNFNFHPIKLILPLGISFYTFRTISYLLDIDKGKIEPIKNWVVFFSYVSFFPSLISGPIDKAKTLVPQLENPRVFDINQATDGLRQILWGIFKKIVIADNCATLTSEIFEKYEILPGSTLLLGAFLYTIQIYADFSGYSDMAIGVARLMGFNITRNFEFPFFSQNIAEFWRKWHISLTNWLTEYVFTPLTITFRDRGQFGLILAIIINFTLIGIWHGANWTFVLFGFVHGCFFIPLIIRNKLNKKKKIAIDKIFPSFAEFINIVGTFVLVMLTFIIFKSEDISSAFVYFKNLFSVSIFSIPVIDNLVLFISTMIFVFGMLTLEWFQRDKQHALQFSTSIKSTVFSRKPIRWLTYLVLIFTILCFAGKQQDFIYFKF